MSKPNGALIKGKTLGNLTVLWRARGDTPVTTPAYAAAPPYAPEESAFPPPTKSIHHTAENGTAVIRTPEHPRERKLRQHYAPAQNVTRPNAKTTEPIARANQDQKSRLLRCGL